MEQQNPFAAQRWVPNRKRDRHAAPPATDPPKPLNIVLPCWKGDQDQAVRLLKWIAELGMVQAPFYLLCSDQCNVPLLLDLARKCFSKVVWMQDRESIESNWHEKGDHPKSAAGPNSLFRQCAWHFYTNRAGPWLFLEPDAIPCRKDWYWMIEREYQLGAKPFMGFHVNPINHPGVPQHMSGVAVYPQDTPIRAPLASNAGEVAFDIAGTAETCRNEVTHWTGILAHQYRPPEFTEQSDFETRVPETLAIYHSDKSGSIIQFLSRRLGVKVIDPGTGYTTAPTVAISSPPPFECNPPWILNVTQVDKELVQTKDIFIKTRPHDYPWLEWCVKSINKFASDFNNETIQSDVSGERIPVPAETEVIWLEPKEPGYLWQQVCKLNADSHSDADFILFMDSDCVFTREVTPSDFIRDGKPIWLYTPMDKARPDQHVWAPVMEKFLGRKPEYEFMRRHPFIVNREMLKDFRTFCEYRHGKTIEEYIMGEADPNNGLALKFSEWNCLGFFLWTFHRDKVHWVLDNDAEPACVYQGFSHGGEARKQEDLTKFKELLGESFHGCSTEPEVVCPPVPTLSSGGTGIKDPIKAAIDFLVSEASRGNYHRNKVLLLMDKAGLKKGGRLKKLTRPPISKKGLNDRLLLAIHSYPGANETFARHYDNYKIIGADRIVGIGTTDGKCMFPCESINIGANKYIEGGHLVQRLIDTVEWCLSQPEERFCIMEYDVLPLIRPPRHKGICAVKSGGQLPGSKATRFYHMPVWFDRESGQRMLEKMKELAPECTTLPDNSPDVFLGYVFDQMRVTPEAPYEMFTRNSLDLPGALDEAIEATLNNVHIIHGVKKEHEYLAIMAALNGTGVLVSEYAA